MKQPRPVAAARQIAAIFPNNRWRLPKHCYAPALNFGVSFAQCNVIRIPHVMRLAFLTALLLGGLIGYAQVPQLLNYQGRVQVGTNDFNGTGQFKFALVNADGTTTFWNNDGTASGQPAATVTLPVTKGLYSVLLGNTNLPGMATVPSAAFTNGDVHLRVWFNDGVNGFQQFVPDQRVVTPAYATTAGTLIGPISVDQLPVGIPRATNGTTTISGDVVVEGTLTAAIIGKPANSHGLGTSGLPAGTTLDVLINNLVAPGVRFESLSGNLVTLNRTTSDLSWPAIFNTGLSSPFTNPPVSIRLTLPNGGVILWNLRGGDSSPNDVTYTYEFARVLGSDGKPYDRITLEVHGGFSRTNFNLSAMGTSPQPRWGGRPSGQPPAAALRLVVDNVNYNNITFGGVIEPGLNWPISLFLNPSYHPALSQWALESNMVQRSVQVVLASGLPGTVQLGTTEDGDLSRAHIESYEVFLGSDGLPIEHITIIDD